MANSPKNQVRNPSPTLKNFEFEENEIKEEKIKYFTDFKVPCRYMNVIDEDMFEPFHESEEDFTFSSSEDESPPPKEASPVKNVENASQNKNKQQRKNSHEKENWSAAKYSDSDDSIELKRKVIYESYTKIKEVEEEQERKPLPLGEYTCSICNIAVSSETTLQTHIMGKKHLKALKSQAVSEVALQSVSLMTNKEKNTILRYPVPGRNKKWIKTKERSVLHRVMKYYDEGPLPGLSKVIEFRRGWADPPTDKDLIYYCKLCDSPCSNVSILHHLIGYKHQLFCLELIDNYHYEKFRYCLKRDVDRKVIRILSDYERKYGRGKISVEREVDIDTNRDEPGPSWRDYSSKDNSNYNFNGADLNMLVISASEDLDMSLSNFRCRVCDSFMNSQAAWETHIRGKRHLKNKKKYPGDKDASKVKAIRVPYKRPHLMHLLRDVFEPVVGLDFIRETQGQYGDMYNCFLCGAGPTSFDIVDHLLSTKHRIKFLENVNQRGQENDIESIKMLSVSNTQKEHLILEECRTILSRYGMGKVDVYKSQSVYPTNSWD